MSWKQIMDKIKSNGPVVMTMKSKNELQTSMLNFLKKELGEVHKIQ